MNYLCFHIRIILDLVEDSTRLNEETSKFVEKLTRFDELVDSVAKMMTEVSDSVYFLILIELISSWGKSQMPNG